MQNNKNPLIQIEHITKVYQMGRVEVHALRDVSLEIQPGEYVAIMGASGSGKSTLMNIIGLLDRPTGGSYHIRGIEISDLSKSKLADLRNREIGFVFQQFNLLARVSAQRQVELSLFYGGLSGRQQRKMALAALERVGLADRASHRPDELSGGQQQRVAIARALVNQPSLLLADEPTGALDTKTGAEVMALFNELHAQGLTVIMVTHDPQVAQRAKRVIAMSDGQIISDKSNGSKDDIVYCFTLLPKPYWGMRQVNVATGQFEDLTYDTYAISPAWDPANPWRLVYLSRWGLVNLDLSQGRSWPLTTDVQDHSPVFSPNGSKIAVSYRQDDHWDIHVLNADGSGRVRLTETSYLTWVQQELNGEMPHSYNNAAPTWSPDGSQLAFLTDRTGQWEIWVMNADGSNQHPMFPARTLTGISLQYNGMDERVLSWR